MGGLAAPVCDWEIDPVAATALRLERIAAHNPRLCAFLSVDADGARAAAEAAARRRRIGRALSRIDGMPIGIKANIAVQGWPFHAGIEAYRQRIATRDAACTGRLRAGGAVLLGLLNMDEAALGDTTDNPHFGRTGNPLRAGYTAGGSSGGAGAAVAAGLCEAALGTDTLGSVRIPAAYCGIVGHKMLPGGMFVDGIVPLAPAYDSVGILAKTVATVEAVRNWLDGEKPVAGGKKNIGVFPLDGLDISPGVVAAFDSVVAKAHGLGFGVQPVACLTRLPREIAKAALLVVVLEAAAVHAGERARNEKGFSAQFLGMLAWAENQGVARQAAARAMVDETAADIRRNFAPYAAVLMPTAPFPAFAFGGLRPKNTADFTMLANIAGLAATAFPVCGAADALPLSVQVVGPDEAVCLAIADRFSAI